MRTKEKSHNSELQLVESPQRLLVFTDLDGTLLHPINYEWQAARSTLGELRRKKIPLVLCTSKTRAEIKTLRRKMGHVDPYIAENGGILVIPWTFFGKPESGGGRSRELVLRLGWTQAEASQVLSTLARSAKVKVRGFHQMSAAEIARATGLTLANARKAQLREASEPFQIVSASPAQMRALRRATRERRIKLAEGGRFWHLTMGTDKGQAMALLIQLKAIVEGVQFRTIAAGDSSIDLPMLKQASLPILMPAPDGKFDSKVIRALPAAIRGRGTGPAAWAEAVRAAVLQCEREQASDLRKLRPIAPANGWQAPALREFSALRVPEVRSKLPANRRRAASQ
jgi:mannosyl-3-phosphoglycerate phosphatase